MMGRVRQGDLDALRVLFERHAAGLKGYFRHLTRDVSASEDLVQEVFVRLLRHRKQFEGGSFRAWMYGIARNLWVDHARSGARQMTGTDPDAAPSAGASAPDLLQRAQEKALVRQALLKLPDHHREVLVLSRFHEMKCEEIAALLDCEVGAVKTRIHRALRQLRDVYARMLEAGSR
jgi:RNA polymerase sigma-70 factor (ECF subfamily)